MFFRRVPTEFVPPGMTPEEARRQRKHKMGASQADIVGLLVSLGLLALLCGGSGWWYFGRNKAGSADTRARLEPSQLTATVLAGLPTERVTNTPSVTPSPTTELPSPTATSSPTTIAPTVTLTREPTPKPTVSFRSPIPTPTPSPTAEVVATIFDSPIPPPSEFDYQLIGQETHPEGLYSYVSGWIVEADGSTPRPVGVRLSFPTGEMRYPRPNNTDIATGHYEFLVSPGRYYLRIDDPGSPEIPVIVTDEPTRYEISFKFLISRPVSPARSQPWSAGSYEMASSAVAPEHSKPDQVDLPSRIYLPISYGPSAQSQRYYLPLLRK